MPKFSKVSQDRLKTCDQRLQDLFNEVIKNYDCSIICGHRGQADQDKAYNEGKSKIKWPNGKHNSNPSRAVDVAPYPIDWNDTKRFYHFAGYVKATADQMGIKIRWGGDWDSDNDFKDNSFNDTPHFELIGE